MVVDDHIGDQEGKDQEKKEFNKCSKDVNDNYYNEEDENYWYEEADEILNDSALILTVLTS